MTFRSLLHRQPDTVRREPPSDGVPMASAGLFDDDASSGEILDDTPRALGALAAL